MEWGQSLSEAAAGASEAGRAAARLVAGAAVDAGKAVKEAAVSASEAGEAAARSVGEAVVDAGEAVAEAAKATASALASKAKEVYKAIADFFSPKLVGQPIQPCPQGIEAKKRRLQKRAALIEKSRERAGSMPPEQSAKVLEAADRFERNNKAVERARLAKDVYPDDDGGRGEPPVGWKRLNDDPEALKKYGLRSEDLTPADSDFRAALYESEIDDSVVVAYKGTTFSSGEDWKNNAAQGLGAQSDYYNRSIRLAQKLDDSEVPFETTGHSLGGGMSSAASAVTHAPGTTFNAAGLKGVTVERYGASREGHDDNIQAYYVEGEILTSAQRVPLVSDAVGTPHKLPAVDEKGQSSIFDPARMIDKHSMDRVINGIEKQKADDQHLLRTALAQE